MSRWLLGVLCVLAAAAAPSSAARGSCLTLPDSDLQKLDAQTEQQPENAIQAAQSRVSAAAGRANGLLRAQLFAVLADAYTEQSQPDKAHAAIQSARIELRDLATSPDSSRLKLRLDLLEDQLLIAASQSAAAVAATTQLLATLPGETLERACTLSIRAIAYDYLHQPDLAVGDAVVVYRLAQSANWPNAKLEAAGTLARVFAGAGLYLQAEQMIDVVIAIAKSDKKTALLSTAEYELGTLLVKARRFVEARAALELSNLHAKELGDPFAIAATNATLCWALIKQGELDAADRVCAGGDEDLANGHRDDLEAQLIGNRALLDLERHRPAAALQKLNWILTPDLHALLPGSEPQFYWNRARALRELQRVGEANADLVRMHELEEAADSTQRNRQVAVLSAFIASEELAAANRLLSERMTLQQKEVERQRQQWITLSVSILVISALLGYLLWISQRHSRALRRQQIIMRSAGQNAPDAFLMLDEQRRVRFANRNLCGHGPVPSVGDPVLSALPAPLVPALTAALDEAFEQRTVVSFSTTLADRDAAPRLFDMWVVPAVENRRVIGGTLRAIDVTDQRSLERQVVDGASHERQRLSSELHEGLGQQLAGVLLLLGNASNIVRRGMPLAAELIEEIAGYVREGIDAARELARGLAPVKIGRGSLTVALESLIGDAARRLRIHLDCRCSLVGIALSDLAADHLYWICREAVTNAALHGRCTKVTVDVHVEGDALMVSITDDGTGMPPGGYDSQGLGLRMMAYRTRLLGGDCRISAAPGGGTRVLVTVPLTQVRV